MKLFSHSIRIMALVFVLSFFSCTQTPIETDVDLISGAYNVTQTGDRNFDGEIDNNDYTMTITQSALSDTRVVLTNLGGFSNVTVDAEVSGSTFTIPQQAIKLVDEVLGISGSGTRTDNTITFSYQFSIASRTYDYSCTGLKR